MCHLNDLIFNSLTCILEPELSFSKYRGSLRMAREMTKIPLTTEKISRMIHSYNTTWYDRGVVLVSLNRLEGVEWEPLTVTDTTPPWLHLYAHREMKESYICMFQGSEKHF